MKSIPLHWRILYFFLIPFRLLEELYYVYIKKPDPDIPERLAEGEQAADSPQVDFWKEAALVETWWGPDSFLKSLKAMEKIRLGLICEAYQNEIRGRGAWDESKSMGSRILDGAVICDVGCGGGVLSEVMAEMGATVTGIDMEPGVIAVAQKHWKDHHGQDVEPEPEYLCALVEDFCEQRPEAFDIVVCSEVLEHVSYPDAFVDYCCRMVRPGGCAIFTTINRTFLALLYSILFTEDFMGVLPHHLHRWHLCVTPEEVTKWSEYAGFYKTKLTGMVRCFENWKGDYHWKLTETTKFSYCLVVKRADVKRTPSAMMKRRRSSVIAAHFE